MAARRNAVQRAFDEFGRSHFREKRSGTWVRRFELVEHRLWLQKSQYGLSYFLNVEIAFREPGGETGEIEGRAERLLTDADGAQLRELLDMEGTAMVEELREHRLLELLTARLGPELDRLATTAGIVEFARAGRTRWFGVTGPARQILVAGGVALDEDSNASSA